MAGLRDDETPDYLTIKKTAAATYHYHYNRGDRLRLKTADIRDTQKKQRIKKITKYLYIVLAVAIIALMTVLLFRLLG